MIMQEKSLEEREEEDNCKALYVSCKRKKLRIEKNILTKKIMGDKKRLCFT